MEITNLKNSKTLPDPSEIQDWIISYLAELLEVEPELVDPDRKSTRLNSSHWW